MMNFPMVWLEIGWVPSRALSGVVTAGFQGTPGSPAWWQDEGDG